MVINTPVDYVFRGPPPEMPGFKSVENSLYKWLKEQRRKTPTPPPQNYSKLQLCVAQHYELPDVEETLDKFRTQVPSGWYQFMIVFANFSLLHKKLGYEGVTPNLFWEAVHEGRGRKGLYTFWRDVADATNRILEQAGTTKDELRMQLRELMPVEDWWEAERRTLAFHFSKEAREYEDELAESLKQQSEVRDLTFQEREYLSLYQLREDGGTNFEWWPPSPTQRAPSPTQRAPSPKRRAPAHKAPKTSRIMNGLDTANIIDGSDRRLRLRGRATSRQAAPENSQQHSPSRLRVAGGRVRKRRNTRQPASKPISR
ncbi:hypothetical protein F4777DRAFT_533717 [Nemania sp. FL0916]|nr:hypothetical protein F4777DRAFT_533717 [Nemania sp. FL0916]